MNDSPFPYTGGQADLPAWPRSATGKRAGVHDAFILPGLPPPLDKVDRLVREASGHEERSRKLGMLFKELMADYRRDDLVAVILSHKAPANWWERFWLGMLDCGEMQWRTARRALSLRFTNLRLGRPLHAPQDAADEEQWIQKMNHRWGISNLAQLAERAQSAVMDLQSYAADPYLSDVAWKRLQAWIGLERESLGVVKRWAESCLNEKDIHTNSPLDYLRLMDYHEKEFLDLEEGLRKGQPLRGGEMSVVKAMGPSTFLTFLDVLNGRSGGQSIAAALEVQSNKRVATPNLVALGSLCRWQREQEGDVSPVSERFLHALEVFQDGRFTLPIETARLEPEWIETWSFLKIDASEVSGDLNLEFPFSWLGAGMGTLPWKKVDREPLSKDLLQAVRENIGRELFIDKLLDNPRVYQASGLVEHIAQHSRSPRVLSKIAASPVLHSHPQHATVPMLLLRNPTTIPISLLRRFLSPAYIGMPELKGLYRDRGLIRQELWEEVRKYLMGAGVL